VAKHNLHFFDIKYGGIASITWAGKKKANICKSAQKGRIRNEARLKKRRKMIESEKTCHVSKALASSTIESIARQQKNERRAETCLRLQNPS
jgi:hypothetical protein